MWPFDPQLVLIFTFVIVALLILMGGFVFRPFLKRLGDVMDRYLREQSVEEREARQLEAVREQLESLDQRMALMEERLDFTESLVNEQREKRELGTEPEGRELELGAEPDARAGSGGG